MFKRGRRREIGISSAAFVAFSVMVALSWMRKLDSSSQSISQEHYSRFLDVVLSFFSLLGSIEVTTTVLLVLLTVLLVQGQRLLAGRLLVAFVATGLLELAMKLYLPHPAPPRSGSTPTNYTEPLDNVTASAITPSAYSYPSGHMLRSVILFGAVYYLAKSRSQRTVVTLALVGVAAARIYFEVHWASDVVGGALLGIAALFWALRGKNDLKSPKDDTWERGALYRK